MSRRFADSGYDVKWLLRAICATEAYQRESRPRREVDGTPFTANVAQPLRSDQLFNVMLTATEADEEKQTVNRRNRPQMMPAYGPAATVRQQMEVAFGYDPSDPRETVTSSIPQALAMMNGVRINLAVRAIGDDTVLGRLLTEIDDDQELVEELYLRTHVARSRRKKSSACARILPIDQKPNGRVRRLVLGAFEFVGIFASAMIHSPRRAQRTQSRSTEPTFTLCDLSLDHF